MSQTPIASRRQSANVQLPRAGVRAAVREQMRDFPELVETLVNVSSQSNDARGLEESAVVVAGTARHILGADVPVTVHRVTGPDAITRPFLVIGANHPDTLLVTHHDMVEPAKPRGFDRKGEFWTGPGVHDDKGPIVTGLFAMQLMQRFNPDAYARTAMYVGADEEIGSASGRKVLAPLADTATLALGLESAEMNPSFGTTQPHGIKIGRKGWASFNINYNGVAEHSGYAEEARPDANNQMLDHAGMIRDFIRSRPGIAGNIGKLYGGDAVNKVSDASELTVEVRSYDVAALDEFARFVNQLPASTDCPGVTWESVGGIGHLPWDADNLSRGAFTAAERVRSALGLQRPLTSEVVPGGSDCNGLPGLTRLDGLGPLGYGDHTDDEGIVAEAVDESILLTYGIAATLTGIGPAIAHTQPTVGLRL